MELRRRNVWTRWWVQVIAVAVVVEIFRVLRAELQGPDAKALANALDIVRIERHLGLLHERTLQQWLASSAAPARVWNVFYGTMHDLVGVVTLVVLWRRDPTRYRRWRNVAGWMLGLGLLGFWLAPVTPPRLMPARSGFAFVDTGIRYGGIGPIQGATKSAGGNIYAAMPSLHVGRSLWAVLALWPVLRRRRTRALVVVYPFAMLAATVVTANHWFLDGAGGLACLAVALALEEIRVRGAPRRSGAVPT